MSQLSSVLLMLVILSAPGCTQSIGVIRIGGAESMAQAAQQLDHVAIDFVLWPVYGVVSPPDPEQIAISDLVDPRKRGVGARSFDPVYFRATMPTGSLELAYQRPHADVNDWTSIPDTSMVVLEGDKRVVELELRLEGGRIASSFGGNALGMGKGRQRLREVWVFWWDTTGFDGAKQIWTDGEQGSSFIPGLGGSATLKIDLDRIVDARRESR